MLKPLIPLSVLAILILSSGCIMQSSGGTGVTIENFEPDFSQISSSEPFQLRLKIGNAGSVEAKDVEFDLLNTAGSGSNNQLSCEDGCVQRISLFPQDADSGSAGETRTCIWHCESPGGIPPGVKIVYNPIIRITYAYNSNVLSSVSFASQEEIRNIQDSGAALPSEVKSSTNTPIKLDLVFKGPIRYWEGQDRITFPIEISLENVGGGVACYPSCSDKDDWSKVKLSLVPDSGISFTDCDFSQEKEILLWEGASRTVRCQAEYSGFLGSELSGRETKTLSVLAEYEYFIEAQTSVEVTGT